MALLGSFTLPASLLQGSSDAQQQLLAHLRLLHLIHHRNHNQHRRSIWYRHFNVFRREVKALCEKLGLHLGPGFTAPDLTAAPSRGKYSGNQSSDISQKATSRDIAAHLQRWIDSGLVENCYLAFSSLVTIGSFSALALALLAILGRICSLTGITAAYQAKAKLVEEEETALDEKAIGAALDKFAREDGSKLFDAFETTNGSSVVPLEHGKEDDRGTVLAREALGPESVQPVPDQGLEGRPRKRKRKGNVIDDLFAGL